ncbi:hypothetical protein HF521_007003 [Silurus meridionalis]|uniref:DUF4806 domain-containing protein n=1 Tax=Silurus meridionalis TaxID=175797 RepID=A0A8T0AT74_SILME|nr:hypothetical protein HF521_007003 [Silurus meridionalis]
MIMDMWSEAEPDPPRAPKLKTKRTRRLLDDYDTDEEAIAPKNLPQAPYIQPLSKRACSALDEVQPSSLQHRPQRSPSVTQVPGTSRQALMERSPTSQWQNFPRESALGKSLRQAIDLSAQSPAQTLFQTAHQMGPEAENYSQLSWQRGSMLQSPEEPTQPLWHRETPGRSYSMDDPFKKSLLHDVLTKLEVIMEQQRNIVRMIQDLKSNNVREITEENKLSPTLFPVEDLRSLTSLESNLRSSPETRRKVVIELGLLGGVDAKDKIWRIMKQTIKNDFAKTMNWKGANGKTPFQGLELKNVVIEAVRRNPACSQTTELEVEKVTKPCLSRENKGV